MSVARSENALIGSPRKEDSNEFHAHKRPEAKPRKILVACAAQKTLDSAET